MPIETIRYVVSGANPQTSSIQVTFDDNGNGSGTISLAGTNSGVDTIQAFLDAFSLSSNQAQVVWQGANGSISISPILGYYGGTQSTALVPSGYTAANFSSPQTFNSLMFNTHPQSLLPGDPHQSGNQANPMVNNAITASGYYSGDVAVNGDPGGGILLSLVGQFVVAQAGQITFQASDNSGFVIGVPGASFVSGVNNSNGVATTPIKGYTVLAGRNGSWPGGNVATDVFTLNFPTPGVYNFEIFFASGTNAEREFCLLANNAVIPPASIVSVPPAPAPGTGQMILTPNSAGPDITGTTQSFTIQISGIQFQTQPYFPVFQGQSAYVLISNDAGDNNFSFPSLPNGGSVDPNAAIGSVFSLSGDNGSWQNRISISWNGSGYELNYNSAAPDNYVATTTLTITNADIAWFNPNNKAFDVFGVSSQGGGSQAQVLIYWLVDPTISSISPPTLNADGGTYQIAVTFTNPLPPIQNNTTATFTAGTGFTINSSTPNFDANGWLLGFTVTVTTDISATDVTTALWITVSGEITYFSGSSLVTQDVTYINNRSFSTTLTSRPTGGSGTGITPVPAR